MIRGLNRLEIFDNFIIDRTLPKFKVNKIEGGNKDNGFGIGGSINTFINSHNPLSSDDELDYAWMHIFERRLGQYNRNPTLGNKFRLFWCKCLINLSKVMLNKELKRDREKIEIYENTEKFFDRVKESFKELESDDSQEIKNFYLSHIEQAEDLRQTALVEKLKDKLDLLTIETKLLENGNFKYVTEEDIVKFSGVFGIKNLHLTWIKNFNRIIPIEIYDLKKEADLLHIFDNYVILHTDATGDVVNETKAERKARIEREKDPILFGVIEKSRKLYYIGDWVDELCDLTLDKMLDVLKKDKADELSVESIKGNLEKVNIHEFK